MELARKTFGRERLSTSLLPRITNALAFCADLGPKAEQLDSHGDDLLREQLLRICTQAVATPEPFQGAIDFFE